MLKAHRATDDDAVTRPYGGSASISAATLRAEGRLPVNVRCLFEAEEIGRSVCRLPGCQQRFRKKFYALERR